MPRTDDKPTSKQLRFLRILAETRGETFTYPANKAQASAEIQRLKDRKPSSRIEVRIDRDQVARTFAEAAGGASRIHDREVEGWGSTAGWAERG